MILELEIENIKPLLGKNRTGAELTLSDTQRPRCLVPFSYYIPDVPTWETLNGKTLADCKFQAVRVLVTEMAPAQMGAGIKLQGEIALIPARTAKG